MVSDKTISVDLPASMKRCGYLNSEFRTQNTLWEPTMEVIKSDVAELANREQLKAYRFQRRKSQEIAIAIPVIGLIEEITRAASFL